MKSKNKEIYVLLRNKIIGIDSILPLCMEINGKYGYNFNFISFEYETYKSIVKNNIVINDMINSIGSIEFVSLKKYKSHYLSIPFILFYFLKVVFNVFTTNGYIVHSAHLHVSPLKWIRYFFRRSNIIFVEKKINGGSTGINILNHKKKGLSRIYGSRLTFDEIDKFGIDLYSHPPLLYAGILIGYNKNWNYFKHPDADKSKKIIFNSGYSGEYLVDFINNNADNYINNQIPCESFESTSILVFIATRITRHSDSKLVNEFVGALKSLSKYLHIFPLFIKLHTFSDTEFIDELIKISLGGDNSNRYVITTLHPMVLARKAIISVFANDGTIMGQFSELNVPVINLQIYENILTYAHLKACIDISDVELKHRYERRKLYSDYTFDNVKEFDSYMKQFIDDQSSMNITRCIHASSQKNVLDL